MDKIKSTFNSLKISETHDESHNGYSTDYVPGGCNFSSGHSSPLKVPRTNTSSTDNSTTDLEEVEVFQIEDSIPSENSIDGDGVDIAIEAITDEGSTVLYSGSSENDSKVLFIH
ncbi:hypothetical protein HK096_004704 [Nowakowskiella sp. JEL0078]|nr:hypothetical protein HK096_004704 [Nowakowskiella sp. JEL0078]